MRYESRDEEMDKLRDELKTPFACPACNRILDHWHQKSYFKYGVCGDCSIDFLESRGHSDEFLKDKKAVVSYCKAKDLEKQAKLKERKLNIEEE